jgi:hypothetical protein
VTSALVPPAATWHWLRGWLVHRRARPHTPFGSGEPAPAPRPAVREPLRS